jgi:uridine monophosphate synthetase
MNARGEAIALLYYRTDSVRFGSYRTADHIANPHIPQSPYNLHYPKPNGPHSELMPELINQIGSEFYAMCEAQTPQLRPRRIAGVPEAALPLARAHARMYDTQLRNLLIFEKHKVLDRHWFTGPQGNFNQGDEVVIDDDFIALGHDKDLMLRAANAGGLVVKHMLTVVDTQQGGANHLAEEGISLHSILTMSELLQFGADNGYVSPSQLEFAQEYQADVDTLVSKK